MNVNIKVIEHIRVCLLILLTSEFLVLVSDLLEKARIIERTNDTNLYLLFLWLIPLLYAFTTLIFVPIILWLIDLD